MISSSAVRQIRRKRRQSSRRPQKEHHLRSTARSDNFTESEEESDHCDSSLNEPAPQDNVDVTLSTLKDYVDDDFDQNYVYLRDDSCGKKFTSLFDGSAFRSERPFIFLSDFLIDSLDKRTSTRLL